MRLLKKQSVLLFCLCLGHGVNDFIAGFLINKNLSENFSANFIMVAVYGIIAFGGQLPLALLIDRFFTYQKWAMLAVVLNFTAILFSFFNLETAIVFSGFASAIYHVAGGATSLQLENKFCGIAIGSFAAPGVIGLTIGTIINPEFLFPLFCVIPVLAILLFIFSFRQPEEISTAEKEKNTKVDFEWHDAIMLLILIIAALRSAVWDVFQELHGGNYSLLLKIAFAAALGKFLGGFLSTRINSIRYVNVSMIFSIVFLHFAEKSQNALLAGIVLLQSGVPASILILRKYFPEKYGFANAAILGLAVFIGAITYNLLPGKTEWISMGVLGLCVLFFIFSLFRTKRQNELK
jgi:FSR family fosmidomycin resistance protein-like MFS transporter